jgi:RNA polymerase sigma factor (sigma-70 family)
MRQETIDSFSSNVTRYRAALVNIVLREAPAVDADIVVQRALEKMWLEYAKLENVEEFMPWAYIFVKNQMLNAIRSTGRRNRHIACSLDEMLYEPRLPQPEYTDPRLLVLENLVNRLKHKDRELLHEVFYEGKKIKDLAERDGVPLQTLYNKINVLKKKIRKYYERE